VREDPEKEYRLYKQLTDKKVDFLTAGIRSDQLPEYFSKEELDFVDSFGKQLAKEKKADPIGFKKKYQKLGGTDAASLKAQKERRKALHDSSHKEANEIQQRLNAAQKGLGGKKASSSKAKKSGLDSGVRKSLDKGKGSQAAPAKSKPHAGKSGKKHSHGGKCIDEKALSGKTSTRPKATPSLAKFKKPSAKKPSPKKSKQKSSGKKDDDGFDDFDFDGDDGFDDFS
jgi:hypothetical protein